MASSSSASDWVCGACASSNKGGKYCTMCATPRLTRKYVLAMLAADFPTPAAAVAAPAEVAKAMAKKIFSAPAPRAVVDAPTAVAAVPAAVAKNARAVVGAPALVAKNAKVPAVAAQAEVAKVMAKKIFPAPTPGAVVDTPTAVAAVPAAVAKIVGAVIGAPAPVAKNAKALVAKIAKVAKESAPVMADVSMPVPVPVAKMTAHKENMTGPFHPSGVVVEIVRTEMGDQGCSCEEHPNNCGEVLADNVVVHLRKVQIVIDGRKETAIAAYWVSDGIDCCCVGFLPCHMVKHAMRYNGALAQVTHVFSNNPMCGDTAERCVFHKNKGCCLAAIIAWRRGYNE
jgi:hypothetical protein